MSSYEKKLIFMHPGVVCFESNRLYEHPKDHENKAIPYIALPGNGAARLQPGKRTESTIRPCAKKGISGSKKTVSRIDQPGFCTADA